MKWYGLGKVATSVAGTKVPVSSTKILAHSVLMTYDASDLGQIYVKDPDDNVLMNSAPTQPVPIEMSSGNDQNTIDLSKLYIDSDNSAEGPYVGYAIA